MAAWDKSRLQWLIVCGLLQGPGTAFLDSRNSETVEQQLTHHSEHFRAAADGKEAGVCSRGDDPHGRMRNAARPPE